MKQMNRRTFLKHTSLATGAVASLAPYSRVLGANDDLRVAVVGFNDQGRTHLRALRELAGVRVVALCDCDRAVLGRELEAAKKRNEKLEGYTDIRQLLQNKEVDAEKEQFVGSGELVAKANQLVTREYRPPFVVPENV